MPCLLQAIPKSPSSNAKRSQSRAAKEARRNDGRPVGAARTAKWEMRPLANGKNTRSHTWWQSDRIIKPIKGEGQPKGARALPKARAAGRVGGGWGAAPRRAADQLRTTAQLVHRPRLRTAAPGARFAANGRRRRTTATGRNHSFGRCHSWSPNVSVLRGFSTSRNVPESGQSRRDLGHTQIPSPLLLLLAVCFPI